MRPVRQWRPISERPLGMHLFMVLAIHSAIPPVPRGAAAADDYKRLDAEQIRLQLIGKQLTDRAHWSLAYKAGGELVVMGQGDRRKERWWIKGGNLCQSLLGPGDCYEVWRSGDY